MHKTIQNQTNRSNRFNESELRNTNWEICKDQRLPCDQTLEESDHRSPLRNPWHRIEGGTDRRFEVDLSMN